MLGLAHLPNLYRLILNAARVINNLSPLSALRVILHLIFVKHILKSILTYISSLFSAMIDLTTLTRT